MKLVFDFFFHRAVEMKPIVIHPREKSFQNIASQIALKPFTSEKLKVLKFHNFVTKNPPPPQMGIS